MESTNETDLNKRCLDMRGFLSLVNIPKKECVAPFCRSKAIKNSGFT